MATEADEPTSDCIHGLTRGDHSATSPVRAARGKLAGGRGPAADEDSRMTPTEGSRTSSSAPKRGEPTGIDPFAPGGGR